MLATGVEVIGAAGGVGRGGAEVGMAPAEDWGAGGGTGAAGAGVGVGLGAGAAAAGAAATVFPGAAPPLFNSNKNENNWAHVNLYG